MGREIRRVKPGWEHPKKTGWDWRTNSPREDYQPLYDKDFETAMKEWLDELKEWFEGEFEQTKKEHPDMEYADEPYRAFCEWYGTAPESDYYRPVWSENEATAFQMYETVSEGTPVTPAFETAEGLIDYLMNHGTFWDDGKAWSREAAEGFVNAGWAPSMVMVVSDKGAKIIEPSDAEMYEGR